MVKLQQPSPAKKQEQFVEPAWIVKLNEIQIEIERLTIEKRLAKQMRQIASEIQMEASTKLESVQQEKAPIETKYKTLEQQFNTETTNHSNYTTSFIETIRYWLAILTGGLFPSARFRSELSISHLNQEMIALDSKIKEQDITIKTLTEEISKQQTIIQAQISEQKKIETIIDQKKERLVSIESDNARLLKKVINKSTSILFSFKNRPLVASIKRFIEDPTPHNLNKLTEKMKRDMSYLQDESLKKLIIDVGKLYTDIENIHTLCEFEYELKQEQIKQGALLAETCQGKTWQEGIAYAENRLLLLQTKYQELQNQQLQETQIHLTEERADQKQSIFLKDVFIKQELLAQLQQQEQQLNEEYDRLIYQINAPESIEGEKKIKAIDEIFKKKYEQTQESIRCIENEFNNFHPKQKKLISDCVIGIPVLTFDIYANDLTINYLLNTIEVIKAGQTPELLAIQEQIRSAQETLNNTKQLAQTVTTSNDCARTSIDITPFLQRREYQAVIHALDGFQKSPTNAHLASLIEAINAELHCDSPVCLLQELNKIGRLYPDISTTLETIQKKSPTSEQTKQMILSDCREYINKAKTPRMTAGFGFFNQLGTPKKSPKKNEEIDDLTAIIALKSVLKNNHNPTDSLETLKTFMQSTTSKDGVAARLIQKASTINESIQSIMSSSVSFEKTS